MSVPWMDETLVPRAIEIDGKMVELEFREYTFLQRQAYNNYVYKHLWEYINDDASMYLLTEIVLPALENNSFIVYQFYGKSNSGKTWLAIAKALEVKWLEEELFGYKNVKIHFVFNHADIGKLLITGGATDGDIIICDEESSMSGVGSGNTEQALANILSSCRAYGVHFFFCDPDPAPKVNVDAWFCICGIAREHFITLSIIEDATNNPIGFDLTRIPVETEDWQKLIEIYNPLKMNNIYKLLDAMGHVGVDVTLEQVADAEALRDYALEQEKLGARVTKDLLNVYAGDLNIQAKGIAYCNNVVTRVIDWRRQSGGAKTRTIDYDEKNKIYWKIIDVGETPLPDDFMEKLEPFIKKMIPTHAKDKKLHKDAHKWFTCYCEEPKRTIQETADTFSVEYGVMQRNLQEIRQSVFGYAVEKLLEKMNPDWELGGGNKPMPDFETDDQIISVKGRVRANRQVGIEDFGKAERLKAIKEDKTLWMYMYEMKYHREITYHRAEPMD